MNGPAEVRIDPEDDSAVRDATVFVIQSFRELVGPVYEKIGYPLASDLAAADALVGSLLEGLVARYGRDQARKICERVIANSVFGGHPPQEGPVFVDVRTGEQRRDG